MSVFVKICGITNVADAKLAEAIEAADKMLACERELFGDVHVEVASTLEILARDPKCRSSEALRIQIAAHHNTPLALAEQLAEREKGDEA